MVLQNFQFLSDRLKPLQNSVGIFPTLDFSEFWEPGCRTNWSTPWQCVLNCWKWQDIFLLLLLFYKLGLPRTEGVDTHKNEFSQEPLGKPLRHYTILAHCTRSRHSRNLWPEPLMLCLWVYMLLSGGESHSK